MKKQEKDQEKYLYTVKVENLMGNYFDELKKYQFDKQSSSSLQGPTLMTHNLHLK